MKKLGELLYDEENKKIEFHLSVDISDLMDIFKPKIGDWISERFWGKKKEKHETD